MSNDTFTNFDINAVPPEQRQYVEQAYKQLQADYTRKRQEDANARREAELQAQELSQRQRDLESSLLDYKTANDAWVNWSQTVAQIDPDDDTGGSTIIETPNAGRTRVTKRSDEERATITASKEIEALKDQVSRLSTALDMSLQIDELRHEFKDVDPKKVIDTALSLKIPDLRKARDIAYRDEDVKTEVDKKVEERLKELQEQERTKVLDRGNEVPFDTFKKMPEAPPSFDAASESILRERLSSQFGSL
jgi:hypothetical protein